MVDREPLKLAPARMRAVIEGRKRGREIAQLSAVDDRGGVGEFHGSRRARTTDGLPGHRIEVNIQWSIGRRGGITKPEMRLRAGSWWNGLGVSAIGTRWASRSAGPGVRKKSERRN